MKLRAPSDEPVHVGLTTGHTLLISSEGTEVDAMFVRAALKAGAMPMGDAPQWETQQQAEVRLGDIHDALEGSMRGIQPSLLGSDGKPDMRKLITKLGFNVHQSEVNAVWKGLQEAA